MDIKDLEELIIVAKKHGLSQLKVGNLEIKLRDVERGTSYPQNEENLASQTEIPVTGDQMPADDVMLYYSADHTLETDKG